MEGKRGDFTRSRNDSRAESLTMTSSNVKCLDATPFSYLRPNSFAVFYQRHPAVKPNAHPQLASI